MFKLPFYGTYNTIYHISDVHIRKNTSRYEEYKIVFQRLYKYLKSEHSGLIVLTGDIVHDKLDVSNEQIVFLKDFLYNLTTIMPTLVTLGNHDCMVGTPGRMNSLRPVVSFLQDRQLPIFLAEQSGEYQLNDTISFGITSPFLNESFMSSQILKSKHKIGIFHGYLNKTSILLGNEHVPVDLKHFRGYDSVLLGDIHNREFLAPNIAYAGSLIQQSMAEDVNHHGLIKWDISKCTGEFIDVPSDYGIHKVHFKDKKWSTTQLSKKSHLVVYYDNKIPTTSDLSLLNTTIESCRYHNIIKQSISVPQTKKHFNFDAIEPVKRYLNNNNLDADQIERIIQLFINYNKSFNSSSELLQNTIPWTIFKVEFSNFMRFKERHCIDFDNYSKNSIVSIAGLNAVGKSSILDAILFGLFGKTPRLKKNIDLLYTDPKSNVKSNLCTISIHIRRGTHQFTIKRTLKRSKSSVIGTCHIYQQDSCISSESLQSNKWINENLNSYDKFLNSFFQTQHSKSFFDATASEINTIFYTQFNMANIESIRDDCKSKLKELKFIISEKCKTIEPLDHSELNDLKTKIETTQLGLKELELKMKEIILPTNLLPTLDFWNKNTPEMHAKTVDHLIETTKSLLKELETVETSKSTLNDKLKNMHTQRQNLISKCDILESDYNMTSAIKYWINNSVILHNNTLSQLKTDAQKAQSLKADKYHFINMLEQFIIIEKEKMALTLEIENKLFNHTLYSNMLSLAPVKLNTSVNKDRLHIYKCMVDKDNKQRVLQDNIDLLISNRKLASHLDLQSISTELERLDYFSRHQNSSLAYLNNKKMINTLQSDINRIELDLQAVVLSIDHLQMKFNRCSADIEELKVFKSNFNVIENYKHQLRYKQNYNELSYANDNYKAKVSRLVHILDKNNAISTELIDLERQQQDLLIYQKMMDNKSEYMQYLTGYWCDIVKESVNNKLNTISIANLEMTIKRQKDFEIFFKNKTDSFYRPIGQASGFEKCIMDLCFRTVWCDLGLMNPCQFYILDEPLTAVDEEKRQHFEDLFSMIKLNFDHVLLVSHLPEIMAVADYSITIKKTIDGSIIEH